MRRLIPALAILAAVLAVGGWLWLGRTTPEPLPVSDGPLVAVPSGQEIRYHDVIQNVPGEGLVFRFRFVAPGISRSDGAVSSEQALADMNFLCNDFAVPRISAMGPQPSQIVISLSDRPVPFGQADPAATQFFEAFRIQDGACKWEPF